MKATWPCDQHSGKLTDVPVGTYRLNIQGEVASELTWRGEVAGIEVNKGQESSVGTVKMVHRDDQSPPVVVQTVPADQDTAVPINISLTATFDGPIVPRSISNSNFKLVYKDPTVIESSVDCTISFDNANHTAILTPTVALNGDATYVATIAVDQEMVVEDLAGNPMKNAITWTFTTTFPDTEAPQVQSATPAPQQMGIALDADIQITFSEQINPLTVTTDSIYLQCNDTIVPADVTYDGRNQTATLSPESALPAGTTCTANVTSTITDLAGNPKEGDETWRFVTLVGPWNVEEVGDFMIGGETSIALDVKDTPYIGFEADGRATISTRESEGNWIINTIDEIGFSSKNTDVTIGKDNGMHYVYFKKSTSQINYFYEGLNAGAARAAIIADGIECGGVNITTDDAHNPHVCFYDETNSQLKYSAEASNWASEVVDTGAGQSAVIAVSPSGTVHIAYLDHDNRTLKYATKPKDGAWAVETVGAGASYGVHTGIALDASGKPHISYVDDLADELKYATLQASGSWSIEVVDSSGNSSAIALDRSNRPHISYLDGSSLSLKYATKTALGTWYSVVVDSNSPTGAGTSILLDSQGYVHISYCNTIAGTLPKYSTTRPPD